MQARTVEARRKEKTKQATLASDFDAYGSGSSLWPNRLARWHQLPKSAPSGFKPTLKVFELNWAAHASQPNFVSSLLTSLVAYPFLSACLTNCLSTLHASSTYGPNLTVIAWLDWMSWLESRFLVTRVTFGNDNVMTRPESKRIDSRLESSQIYKVSNWLLDKQSWFIYKGTLIMWSRFARLIIFPCSSLLAFAIL